MWKGAELHTPPALQTIIFANVSHENWNKPQESEEKSKRYTMCAINKRQKNSV